MLVVESTPGKNQLPEAPLSITVKAIYKGFEVLITRRSDEQSVIPQIPGIVALVDKLAETGFDGGRVVIPPGLTSPEIKGNGNEKMMPICAVHHNPMVWREGNNAQTGRHYAFWACPEKNADGSFCKYRPGKNKNLSE